MWRALLIFLGFALILTLEFLYLPGHSYLRADSQIFVPMVERLNAPGFLSRDLVAVNPHLTYTIYDEATLFLHRFTGQNFESVLLVQLFASRAAGLLGIFLLALAARLEIAYALLISAVVNAGFFFPGLNELVPGREPIPHVLAFGFTLLALGFLAREKPLLAGFAGGIALTYDLSVAALFWALMLVLFFDRKLRYLARPVVPIFVVFALLLANLAQLQPGVVETQSLFSRISEQWSQLQHQQTPEVWVSTWRTTDILFYLVIFSCSLYATARIRTFLNRQSRWIFLLLPCCGLVSLPLSVLLLDYLHWSLIAQLQPVRALFFVVDLALVAFGVAGFKASQELRVKESCLWFLLLSLGFLYAGLFKQKPELVEPSGVRELAAWAEANTWGSSMFLFPDAGRALYPGVFRARAVRAVYVDWNTRRLTKYFEKFARDWQERWQQTMEGSYSRRRLQSFQSIPVDYYVLQRRHQLPAITPVYASRDFIVYDAHNIKKW